ncbi:hypothetical protein EON65_34000 [archaeon]|nr:MAG: hypothetical protein EON65_34000 [archaeon]
MGHSGPSTRYQGGGGWTFVLLNDLVTAPSSLATDTRRLSRLPKIAPDFFFASQVQYAVYLDAKLIMQAEPKYIAQLMTEQRAIRGDDTGEKDGEKLEQRMRSESYEGKSSKANGETSLTNSNQTSASAFYESRTVLLMVQHPITEDAEHDAYLVLQNRRRPNITRYRSLLRKQVRWYSSVAQVRGRVNQTFCLRHTFEGAFLVHDLHAARAGRGASHRPTSSGSGDKWTGDQVRCMWLREYLQWSDRDQGAGAFSIATAVHHTLNTLPVSQQQAYLSQIACNKRNRKSFQGDFLPVHFDAVRKMVFDVRILPAQYYLWRKSELLAKFQRLKWQE